MRYIITYITIAILILLSMPLKAEAAIVAGSSAEIKREISTMNSEFKDEQVKRIAIERVLRKNNSPLANEAATFVEVAHELDLDPFLLPSITGVESTFAQFMIDGTYNPFGFGKGTIVFNNWSDGIAKVGYALRFKYVDKGADTLDKIGHRYAGGSTTWAGKVSHFIKKFEAEEARIRTYQSILES